MTPIRAALAILIALGAATPAGAQANTPTHAGQKNQRPVIILSPRDLYGPPSPIPPERPNPPAELRPPMPRPEPLPPMSPRIGN